MKTNEICARECRVLMRRYALIWRDQKALGRDSQFMRLALREAEKMRLRAAFYRVLAVEGEA